jgi:hypothetical protein
MMTIRTTTTMTTTTTTTTTTTMAATQAMPNRCATFTDLYLGHRIHLARPSHSLFWRGCWKGSAPRARPPRRGRLRRAENTSRDARTKPSCCFARFLPCILPGLPASRGDRIEEDPRSIASDDCVRWTRWILLLSFSFCSFVRSFI